MEAGGFEDPRSLLAAVNAMVTPEEAAKLNELTASMTVADVGQALYWKLYRDKEKKGFFKKLSEEQQAMLVAYLTHIGFAPQTIAIELDTSEQAVREHWARYADKLGQHVIGIRLQTLVGDLKAKADQLFQSAMAEGKLPLAWKITTDFVKVLQDLNIVERAAQKQEVTHKLELDEADLMELDGLMELRKKRKDAKRLLTIEEEKPTHDPLPEIEE